MTTRRLGRVTVPARGLLRFVSPGSRDDQFLREICYDDARAFMRASCLTSLMQHRFNIQARGASERARDELGARKRKARIAAPTRAAPQPPGASQNWPRLPTANAATAPPRRDEPSAKHQRSRA